MRFHQKYGFYELNPFPGCNQVVVSNHAFIYPEFRGKGYGKYQHKQRLQKAKAMGYDVIICTVKADNERERAILLRFGWNQGFHFLNNETNNELEFWWRKL